MDDEKRAESTIPETPDIFLINRCTLNLADNLCKIIKIGIFFFNQSGRIGSKACTLRHVLRCAATNTLLVKFKSEFELDLQGSCVSPLGTQEKSKHLRF